MMLMIFTRMLMLMMMLYHCNRGNAFIACALWYYYCYEWQNFAQEIIQINSLKRNHF